MNVLKPFCLFSLMLLASMPVMAELEPLFVSGQPGLMVDADNDGTSDGIINTLYDPATAVIVLQADESLGGGVVIYQIQVSQFGAQIVQEIGQFPPTGTAELTSSKTPDQFLTFFLDTLDVMTPAESVGKSLLQLLMGGQ